MAKAPGLCQWLPFLHGPMARMRDEPLGFLMDGRNEFGDVFRIRIGPLVFHQLAHPDHVRHVLLDQHRNYPRSWYYRRLRVVVGDGLVTTEGPTWRRLRRLAQPSFHQHRMAALAESITEVIESMRLRWRVFAQTGDPLDVASEFTELTLQIVGRTLLGVDLSNETDRIGESITTLLAYIEHRISNLVRLPHFVPTPGNLNARRAIRFFDTLISEIIAARRRDPEQDLSDLLSVLLSTRDEETCETLSDREVRDQVITFIGAGHETTAVALTWTIYLLTKYPDVQERLRDEVFVVLGDRLPGANDLPRLGYTRRVIQESLRLYPPVYAVARGVREADEIGGYSIPARSMVILSPYVTHHHPGIWPEPETFDPDRFKPENSEGRPRFAWYPFLGGPHQCIGQEFALMEATLTVAMIVQAFRFQLVPGVRVEPAPLVSLRPSGSVPVILKSV